MEQNHLHQRIRIVRHLPTLLRAAITLVCFLLQQVTGPTPKLLFRTENHDLHLYMPEVMHCITYKIFLHRIAEAYKAGRSLRRHLPSLLVQGRNTALSTGLLVFSLPKTQLQFCSALAVVPPLSLHCQSLNGIIYEY